MTIYPRGHVLTNPVYRSLGDFLSDYSVSTPESLPQTLSDVVDAELQSQYGMIKLALYASPAFSAPQSDSMNEARQTIGAHLAVNHLYCQRQPPYSIAALTVNYHERLTFAPSRPSVSAVIDESLQLVLSYPADQDAAAVQGFAAGIQRAIPFLRLDTARIRDPPIQVDGRHVRMGQFHPPVWVNPVASAPLSFERRH